MLVSASKFTNIIRTIFFLFFLLCANRNNQHRPSRMGYFPIILFRRNLQKKIQKKNYHNYTFYTKTIYFFFYNFLAGREFNKTKFQNNSFDILIS